MSNDEARLWYNGYMEANTVTLRLISQSCRLHLRLPSEILKSSEEKQAVPGLKAEEDFFLAGAEESVIICRNCGSGITSLDAMIAVHGRHAHTFRNPAGFTFRIGCFFTAPGCSVTGKPTSLHSWFAGFTWQVAYCSRCRLHLGWHYDSTEDSFFGLILDRLAERTRTH